MVRFMVKFAHVNKFNNVNVLKSASMALFLLGSMPAFDAHAAVTQPQNIQFASETLTITPAKGEARKFTVELALTDAQREYGLMFRKSMPADHGMLFDFGTSRQVMMWMENTQLPLDMLFLDEKGTVTHIQANAVPYSEDIIDSGQPVKYVIELNGGIVKKLGLAVGDRVSSPTIAKGLKK
ncbi:DUF192 domain-containing protein [Neorhizobium sp. P12A]|uniref:DUF192 domain-containing protein n=1 Tax=Neorhizobium sp. P12A TaxID=2268027 RepID=UPI0011EC0F7E|nr:DUF192 domain-containing protein [Neorhizobium sp. P12A]KAA0694544.1 DUF192 domain-containing protein [Neorhizobium sp. P12A]